MTDREAFEAWKNRPVRLAGEYVPMWQTWGPGEERIALEAWQAALALERHWARKSVVAWLDPSDPDADSCIVLDRIRKHGKDNGMEWWKRYTVPLYAAPPAVQVEPVVFVPRNPSQEWFDKVANALHISDADVKAMHDAFLDAAPPADDEATRLLKRMTETNCAGPEWAKLCDDIEAYVAKVGK